MSMCMPGPGTAAGWLLSGQLNAFGVFSFVPGSRGTDQFAAPNMFMLDGGRALGTRQFLNLELMGTTELWTYPGHGYPELLQVGEERADGEPFIDAQHPHSSPVMGLTLSDTVRLGAASTLKLFFAPRGESTDGPVAYMHRKSARDDPDAPLGHHVGQDVGHISSTVLGAALDLAPLTLEASVFNGTEPSPTRVDLPIGALDSEALRVSYALTPGDRVMASLASVRQSDPDYPGASSATRQSASLYDHLVLSSGDAIDHTFIIGSITRHPTGTTLTSFLDEVVLQSGRSEVWGRIEVLQRLASELEIPLGDKRWVSALTVGYTYWPASVAGLRLGLGSSLTVDVLPSDWAAAYGNRAPLTARLIVQIRGAGQVQK